MDMEIMGWLMETQAIENWKIIVGFLVIGVLHKIASG